MKDILAVDYEFLLFSQSKVWPLSGSCIVNLSPAMNLLNYLIFSTFNILNCCQSFNKFQKSINTSIHFSVKSSIYLATTAYSQAIEMYHNVQIFYK